MSSLGSVLQRQLQNDGAPLHDGLELMRHIVQHKTSGHLRHLVWLHEDSTLEHEYLMLSVIMPGDDRLSWMRLERLGTIGSNHSDTEARNARLHIALSPQADSLLNPADVAIEVVEFDLHQPTLIDLAHFVVILYEEVPNYTLTTYNCWWFARRLFVVLAKNYLSESPQKGRMIESIEARFFARSINVKRLVRKEFLTVSIRLVSPMVRAYFHFEIPFVVRDLWMPVLLGMLMTDTRIQARLESYMRSNTGARRIAHQKLMQILSLRTALLGTS